MINFELTNAQIYQKIAKRKNEGLFKAVFQDLKISRDEKDILTFIYNHISNKKYWNFLKNDILEKKKLIDFIPYKFYKMYLSLEHFLPITFDINFSLNHLKLSRNFEKSIPPCYLLLLLKRIKVTVPRRLILYILKMVY